MKPGFRVAEARRLKGEHCSMSGFIGVRTMSRNLQALPEATACSHRANLQEHGLRYGGPSMTSQTQLLDSVS
jgi:hypothetical protein